MRADNILDEIDTALWDYSVGVDAMRSAPDLPPPPVRPRPNGRSILVERLVDRHGLTPEQAREAVWAVEYGQVGEHAELAATEAQTAAGEMLASMRAAFRPMLERVAAQFKQIAEAFEQLRQTVACDDHSKPAPRRDRPAWQSPYGPARRRR